MQRSVALRGPLKERPPRDDGERYVSAALASSLRAQRSNPVSRRGKALDCFAALAMTMWPATCHEPSCRERSMPGDPSGKTPVNPLTQKYSTFPNFGFVAYTAHPGPAKGAFATVTRCGPGLRWTRQRRRATCETGRETVSLARRGTTRRGHSGWVGHPGRAHASP